jgi:hypothetical protein
MSTLTNITLQIETDKEFENVPITRNEFPFQDRQERMTLKEIINIIETSEDDDQVDQAKKFLLEQACRLGHTHTEFSGFPLYTLVGINGKHV